MLRRLFVGKRGDLVEESASWIAVMIAAQLPAWSLARTGMQSPYSKITMTVGAVAVVSLLLSMLVKGPRKTVSPTPKLEVLKREISEYCCQRRARRRQRPWLVLSLLCYACAYATAILEMLHEKAQWGPVFACLITAFMAMVFAGTLAEGNPAEDGKAEIVRRVREFIGSARSQAESEMLAKLDADHWLMEDLINFAKSEPANRH
jgi:hypothetical protein